MSTSTCAKDMWQLVSRLREGGVTVILTTHYIEMPEESPTASALSSTMANCSGRDKVR